MSNCNSRLHKAQYTCLTLVLPKKAKGWLTNILPTKDLKIKLVWGIEPFSLLFQRCRHLCFQEQRAFKWKKEIISIHGIEEKIKPHQVRYYIQMQRLMKRPGILCKGSTNVKRLAVAKPIIATLYYLENQRSF